MNILDQYIRANPSPRNAVDLFKGEWASLLPAIQNCAIESGGSELFNDDRISWAAERFGGFENRSIIELGPLEGGHSYMAEQMGASSVLAIEANSRAYLKCLIVKELYALKKCRFLLGDFVEYLKQTENTFDCCIASGVLYHMQNPAELLSLIARVSDRAIIWTHYFDEETNAKKSYFNRRRFGKGEPAEFSGFHYTRFRQNYGSALSTLHFCGGPEKYSYWMKAEEIIACLKHFGFKKIEINFNRLDHPNGPSFCLACSK